MSCDSPQPRLKNLPPGRSDQAAVLATEARYLHSSFFGDNAPDDVINRYVTANILCCPAPGSLTDTIVARRLDAEAVELFLRWRNKDSRILTKKIRIIFYLVEVRSEYYPAFFGKAVHNETRFRAALGLLSALPQTAWKYLKGAYLVHTNRLSENGPV